MNAEITNIWKDFHQELKRFIQSKTLNSTDTDDIIQEVFIKIIKNIDKVNQAKNMRNYLYGIVRNAVYDFFRNKKNAVDTEEIDEEKNAFISEEEEESLTTTIADCCVKPFIQKLPDQYKEALSIAEFQDVSQKELAEKLNISYSGAKSRVQRGRTQLKELILDCCAYESDAYGNLRESEKKDCSC